MVEIEAERLRYPLPDGAENGVYGPPRGAAALREGEGRLVAEAVRGSLDAADIPTRSRQLWI